MTLVCAVAFTFLHNNLIGKDSKLTILFKNMYNHYRSDSQDICNGVNYLHSNPLIEVLLIIDLFVYLNQNYVQIQNVIFLSHEPIN